MVIAGANGRDITTPAELEAQVRAVQQAGRGAIVLRLQVRGQPEGRVAVRLRAGQ